MSADSNNIQPLQIAGGFVLAVILIGVWLAFA
jgi:hypothetical protein